MRYQEEHASARVPDETEQGRDAVSCEIVTKRKNTLMQTTDGLNMETKTRSLPVVFHILPN